MLSEDELERLLEAARVDRTKEPAFFQQLLDGMVYAHAPATSRPGEMLRLVQFRHPDGFDAIPFFTSRAKSEQAGSATIRTLYMGGRALLDATKGATLMLNPNDGGAVLYPEEISALLKTGYVADVERLTTSHLASFVVQEDAYVPAWLLVCLRAVYEQLLFVQVAYAMQVRQTPEAPRSILIAVGVAPAFAERAARATTLALQPVCVDLDQIVDVTVFDPAESVPAYLRNPVVKRFYGKLAH